MRCRAFRSKRLDPTLQWQLAAATIATGLAAGVSGAALTLGLHLVQHVSFGYTESTFLIGVQRASPERRVVALAAGGIVVGLGWWVLRRRVPVQLSVEDALHDACPRLPWWSSVVDSSLQIVAVGVGGSLGREGAPRQVGAAAASWLADRFTLDPRQRRTLLAAGAGAGLAAVYNVPLGGTVFAAEILLASAAVADVVPVALSCAIATAVAWTVLGDSRTYDLPHVSFHPAMLAWAALFGPLAGLLARGFDTLMVRARGLVPSGWRLPVLVAIVFTLLGVVSLAYPQLLGNGKGPAELAFTDGASLPLFAVLVVLKPLATAACIGSGARGGLLTPALATGAMFGALTGGLWLTVIPGGSEPAFALIGAAAVLAATQRAPITGIVLTAELTGAGPALVVPIIIAVAAAVGTHHALARREDPQRA